ncbi:hypothetical protein [Novosphingobium sp.]|uniref:hypothetical protein n=1 Tax=Novosphingobium sp. TaxID=1874826 RepID=UPI0038B9332C
MNLRILKKLSKRAAVYLPLLGDHREQFRSERDDNYHGMHIRARKHFERCPSIHTDTYGNDEIVIAPRSRAGHRWPYIKVRPPVHPRRGTIMVGATTGYYEPEWDEECAWSALDKLVLCHFTDWSDWEHLRPTRNLNTPAAVFAAADVMLREHGVSLP